MAPEYGATCGFFPVDEEALNYMRLTGRNEEQIKIVGDYCKANGLFFTPENEDPDFTEVVEIDLSEIEANLSGPKRPQDLIPLSMMKDTFHKHLVAPAGNQGFGLEATEINKEITVKFKNGEETNMKTGAIAIAAITSCTNTSNPYVLVAAGLVAKKATELGMEVPKYVKTSLAPGSKVVTGYLENSGLLPHLEKLGFNLVGYGCTTCIGNSGPLADEIEEAVAANDLLVTSVLSGNRNFEGRIHPLVKGNYLASPPLVVAYALAGTVDIDLQSDSLGKTKMEMTYSLKIFGLKQKKLTKLLIKLLHLSYSEKNMGKYLMITLVGTKLKQLMKRYMYGMIHQHTFKTHHSLKV
jgi:aconitate hydratase